MRKSIIFMVAFLWINWLAAQFPPPAGQNGSTAIYVDSSVFIAWAQQCMVARGPLDISSDPTPVSFGTDIDAIGKADNQVVSLGDGGTALLTFNQPIINGEGYDFAVFENGLTDTFLELAFVEVSSNGIDFYRFPSISYTQTIEQVNTFGALDATQINNLAGKYRVFYGTPFDLEEMSGAGNLDINHITHIRIRDVVGCIQAPYATYDTEENMINDPWPTPFESGGFDLDAVGVIHQQESAVEEIFGTAILIYPNPVNETLNVYADTGMEELMLVDGFGNILMTLFPDRKSLMSIPMTNFQNGYYFLKIKTGQYWIYRKIIKV